MNLQFKHEPTREEIDAKNYKGRVLNDSEIEAENKSIKLPKGKFARIPPVLGTLGYMFRNIPGGNEAIIRYMEIYISKQSMKRRNESRKILSNFIEIWKHFDDFSKKRVDVFDWLCKKAEIDPARIWGAISEGMFDAHEADIAVELITAKTDVLSAARKFMGKERNFKDRELVSKATKLVEDKGMEVNVDARTQVNNLQLGTSSFNAAIRANEELIRDGEIIDIPKKEVKEITEGNRDYIDTEFFQTQKEISHVNSNSA